jgi:ADP-ribosyl-[dinitrogen reductase] hydrolase
MKRITRDSRIAGALLGFAAGDALGATTEFMSPKNVRKTYGVHRNITGGGVLNWRPGQGTDDSDLMFTYARVCRRGYSLKRLADAYLAWLDAEPKDVGGTTQRALKHYAEFGDPTLSGAAVATKTSVGNGSLMCSLPTGLISLAPGARTLRARVVSGITHTDPRCEDSCIAYAHLTAALVRGDDLAITVRRVRTLFPQGTHVEEVLRKAPKLRFAQLRFSGYVLDSLTVAAWAICQDDSLENLLIKIVNQGDDADTTAAIAGGLLGARDGEDAVPERWRRKLEYAQQAVSLGKTFALGHHSC